MKYLALILILAATSAYAGGDEIVWTSDTTYIKGGVECYDIEGEVQKAIDEYLDDSEASDGTVNDYDRMRVKYDQNPRLIGAEPWMFRTDAIDWC